MSARGRGGGYPSRAWPKPSWSAVKPSTRLSANPGRPGSPLGAMKRKSPPGLSTRTISAKKVSSSLMCSRKLTAATRSKDADRERQLPVADLQHPVAHELPGGAHVVALEVRAHPGAAPLPQEVRGEPGPAAQLQAELPLHRRQVPEHRVDRLPLLERPAKELELPGLGYDAR